MPDMQKQTVQWFPGHMAKTRRLIKESLPLVDCVTELLDARIPLASRNPELDTLTEREAEVIRLRYGLEDGRCHTLEEVGKQFEVTRERIRQIEVKAIRKLRHVTRSNKLKGFT